jgi:radical SAM-linked protein
VCRLRFRFSKEGSLALISHLDTLRMLERALRRSGVPVSFTGGFHPLPRLQLALPLPLGVEGGGEWMDLEFVESVDPAAMRERLQPQLPPGFALLEATAVPVFGPSLSQELDGALWTLELRTDDPAVAPTAAQWQAAVAALLTAEQLPWYDTDKKGRPRERDCRPALRMLALETVEAGTARLRLEAAVDPAGRSLKPEQLRHWLGAQLSCALSLGLQRREHLSLKPVLASS